MFPECLYRPVKVRTMFVWLKQGTVAVPCEHGNKQT